MDKAGLYTLEYPSSKCQLSSIRDNTTCTIEKESFDVVIIAAPQTIDKGPIKIKGFDHQLLRTNFTFPGHYHRTVATFVHGDPNPSYFGCSDAECLTEAYFFVDPNNNINSIAKQVIDSVFRKLHHE